MPYAAVRHIGVERVFVLAVAQATGKQDLGEPLLSPLVYPYPDPSNLGEVHSGRSVPERTMGAFVLPGAYLSSPARRDRSRLMSVLPIADSCRRTSWCRAVLGPIGTVPSSLLALTHCRQGRDDEMDPVIPETA